MHILINTDFNNVKFVDKSIDAIITDPPYGITSNSWDSLPVDFIDILVPKLKDGFSIVSCADIRYASFLINRYPDLFSHDLVWKKTVGSGQLNINRQPLRLHELILIFRKKGYTYNRIKKEGSPYTINRNIESEQCYGKQNGHIAENDGHRDMTSVLEIKNRRYKGGHPTQKPIELFTTLSEIYSIKDQIILDPFSGSGVILDIPNRITIGIEISKEYYELARSNRKDRILKNESPERNEFQKFISNLSDFEYTIFSP
ncbi:MAG: DNA-methyltransferase [Sphingobacteriaceae bacterium]